MISNYFDVLCLTGALTIPFFMVLPSEFSADRKGYKSYLLALGVDPKNQAEILANAIPYATFKAADRQSIQEKIDYAGAMAERMYAEYIAAKAAGLEASADMSEGRWSYFAAQFQILVRLKNAGIL